MTEREINKSLLIHIYNKGSGKGNATAVVDGGAKDIDIKECGPVTYCTPERRASMKLPALDTKEETNAFADEMIKQLIIIENAIEGALESIQSHIDKGAHNE